MWVTDADRYEVTELLQIGSWNGQLSLGMLFEGEEGGESILVDKRDEIQQCKESIGGSTDRLHRLGTLIQQSSTGILVSRLQAFPAEKSSPSLEETSTRIILYLFPNISRSLQRLLSRSVMDRYFRLNHERNQQGLSGSVFEERIAGQKPRSASGNSNERTAGEPSVPTAVPSFHREGLKELDADEKDSQVSPEEIELKPKEAEKIGLILQMAPASPDPRPDVNYPQPPRPMNNDRTSWEACYLCTEMYTGDHFQDSNWWRHVTPQIQ